MNAVIKFLTSVKLAIVLIIVIILASVLGTLIPQDRGQEEYAARYGRIAVLMTHLQLTHLYHSLWYLTLLLLLALNIIVCSLERLGPKLRKAVRPDIGFEASGLHVLKLSDRFKRPGALAHALESVRQELRRLRFRVREEGTGKRRRLLARKKILGIFGSDIVHLGLIVILAGGILSGLLGRRQYLPLEQGQSAQPFGSGFSVRLDKFETEMYPRGGVRSWKSTVTVVENGTRVMTQVIEVNRPLSYRGVNFYQSSYGWDWSSPSLELWVKKKSDPAFLEKRRLRPGEKAEVIPGIGLSVARFVPDFIIGRDRQVASRSDLPNNPAAQVAIVRGSDTLFSGWVFAAYPDFTGVHSGPDADYTVELKDAQAPEYSVLEAASDPGAGVIWAGCALVMAGLFLAFYWPPREIRVLLEESGGKTEVIAGGLSSKAQEAFESEFRGFISSTRRSS